MKLVSLTATGKSKVNASDVVFGAKPNPKLVAQAVRVYMANMRQGSSVVQTRSEVSRTKRKWYKQKGTGNARHGARSAHIFVGGGAAHAPDGSQNWSLKMNRQMKLKALNIALSMQVENVVVADQLMMVNGKTAEAVKMLRHVAEKNEKILVVLPESSPKVLRSLRNIPTVRTVTASRVNAYDVAAADKILMTKATIKKLEERLQ